MTESAVRSRSTFRRMTGSWWREFPFKGRALLEGFAALVTFVAIGAIAGALVVGPLDATIGSVDRALAQMLEAGRTPLGDTLTWWGSTSADFVVKVPAAVLLAALFLWRYRRWLETALLGGVLIFESTAFVLISFLIGRERPDVVQLDSIPPTGSFPSGHAAAAVVFYGALAIIVWLHTENRLGRWTAGAVAGLMPLIVAFSRMYRGMHFLSDVIAGIILGLASLAVVLWLLRDETDDETGVLSTVGEHRSGIS